MSHAALILAHGQPSDPVPAEADLAALAALVAAALPGWRIRSATLACEGAIDAALAGLETPVVFPFFMSDGWFTRTEVPRRLALAGAGALKILPAFGLMSGVHRLAAETARRAALGRGWQIGETRLVLAAHGSGRSRAPAQAARRIEAAIAAAVPFRDIRTGFIEEPPFVEEAAADAGDCALCLPLFVARWGHVETDVPAALERAGFRGACLDPLGSQPGVAGIIAEAIRHAGGPAPGLSRA